MRYVSTRGTAPDLSFDDVVLTGLARDGGLYVPAEWPVFSADTWRGLRGKSYAEVAAAVMAPFVGDSFTQPELLALARETYAGFRHPAVAPLVQIGTDLWVMELFHGATFAFKDYALQFLGRLFDRILARTGRRLAILGATSGDTGSAAIEACRGRSALDIFMIYPHGRVSEVQRRQMTTIDAANVHVLAVDGTFDDGQDIVKRLFSDLEFRDAAHLGAVNSINWARIMAQVVYYATAALALGAPDRPVRFAVPTGNFGNVYAGWVARRMGLPIERLVIGTNRNDVVTRFFETGRMSLGAVEPSLSPSMDIQISSNLERLLFEMMDRDGPALAAWMDGFRKTGSAVMPDARMAESRKLFRATRIDDPTTERTIAAIAETTGQVIDPHTAIAVAAATTADGPSAAPMVALACAHPAKFGDTVARAIGREVVLPARLAALMTAPEYMTRLAADPAAVRRHMAGVLGLNSIGAEMATTGGAA